MNGSHSLFGGEETEFNDQVAELNALQELVSTITVLLIRAPGDISYGVKAFRVLSLLRIRLNSVFANKKYKQMYGGRMRKIDVLNSKTKKVMEFEMNWARQYRIKNFVWPCTSSRLIGLLDELFNELLVLKRQVGLGIKTRAVFNERERIRSAMD